jgi:hypothetical protein
LIASPFRAFYDPLEAGGLEMSIALRAGVAADATACGTICYEAFKAVCSAHNFPPDFP